VGSQDEQSEERSAGDRDGGGDLRLIAPLPSVDEQMSFIEQRAEEKSPALSVPQEVIDATLQAGSGFSEGKMRIYEQFQKSLSAKENADFLKKEYGIGGSSHAGGFAEYNQFHDGKGLDIAKGYVGDDIPRIRLTWAQVEKRIAELIRLGRYLNPKEQASYPDWLANQEEQRREAAERKENREILSAAPPEKETESETPAHYEYHLGDTVYLGAQEYEIISFDDRRVLLHDVKYPLFQREESRENFDRMVAENPMNDHLKVKDDSEKAVAPAAPPEPTWEKKRSRAETFDLHPNIPAADRLTFDLASHEVEEVGKKERFYRNLYAIQVLQKCREENRFATQEEQITLSKYVGWGGLAEAFDESNSAWETQYLELKTALMPDEYESARESTLTAFYTPPAVINGIYKAMERMGFKDGNVLEPSCGIGNFIGLVPDSMSSAKFYGVEMDKVSAGIAQQLYQRASIAAQPFENANIPDSFFDAVVGNHSGVKGQNRKKPDFMRVSGFGSPFIIPAAA
jgi:hypothetical protein